MNDTAFTDSKVIECIESCARQLPAEYRNRPWTHPELSNGTALLRTEEGMNCYMAAYGEMHYVKCLASMQNFPYETINGMIEIVDWGCGQGIGSLTVIENLQNHSLASQLQQVTLIEPSPNTLQRAAIFVKGLAGNGVRIEPVNRYLPTKNSVVDNEIDSLPYHCSNVIHVFSNILDVADFDFVKLAEMTVASGRNVYVLCMGPMNFYSYRIDQFCSAFDAPQYFSNISEKAFRRMSSSYKIYGCKTRCFKVTQPTIHVEMCRDFVVPTLIGETPILNDYDPRYAVECGLISEKMNELSVIIGNVINPEDIFYLKPSIQGDAVDALVVSKGKGILLVKLWEKNLDDYEFVSSTGEDGKVVIDYQNIRLKKGDGTSIIPTPLAVMDSIQKELVTHHLSDLLEIVAEDYRQIDVIKKVIVFAHNRTETVRSFFAGHWNYNALLGSDLFEDARMQAGFIRSCYFHTKVDLFDDQLMRRFLHFLSPRWHSFKEGKALKLTKAQNTLAESRPRARQKISGVAGSGKTQVLCQRAVNAQKRTGGNVLILSYNITLANYLYYRLGEVCADFPWDKFRVSHYHEFFRSEANNCGLHVGLDSFDDGSFFDGYVKMLPKYDAVFIDEVQDYKPEWLSNVMKFLEPNAEFVVFGDSAQNIFHRPLDKMGDIQLGAAIGSLWNKDLKRSMRIANPRLSALANAFKAKWMDDTDLMDTSNELERSLLFELQYEYFDMPLSAAALDLKIQAVLDDMGFEQKDTVVLSQIQSVLVDTDYAYRNRTGNGTSITFASKEEIDNLRSIHGKKTGGSATCRYAQDVRAKERNKKLDFSMDSRLLKFSTIHSFKGWEANNVILILLPLSTETGSGAYAVSREQNLPALIYTALTRAKENLYILNLGNQTYKEFFETNLNSI